MYETINHCVPQVMVPAAGIKAVLAKVGGDAAMQRAFVEEATQLFALPQVKPIGSGLRAAGLLQL